MAAEKPPLLLGIDVTLLLVKSGVFCPYPQKATNTVLSSIVLGANHPAPLTITDVPLAPVAGFMVMDGWVTVKVVVATRPMLSVALIIFVPSGAFATLPGIQTVVGLITPWVSIVITPLYKDALPITKEPLGMLPPLVISVPVINNWVPRGPLLTGVTVSERASTVKVVVAAGTPG
jgi:hypothetical protein